MSQNSKKMSVKHTKTH